VPLDENSLQMFMTSEYPKQVAALTLITGSRAVAEDVVQEALVRAWERSRKGQDPDSLPAWVMTVSVNLARSRFRKLRAEGKARRELAQEQSVAPEPPSRSQALDVRREVRLLPRSQREVLVLRYYLGLTVAETAERLKLTEGSVKTTLYRARQALGSRLGESEEEELALNASLGELP
jgi:RNA polymerase sigma-70 factor (ECF subfamily)